jgi:CubicO group peptidase (beta-lactamase class C family)
MLLPKSYVCACALSFVPTISAASAQPNEARPSPGAERRFVADGVEAPAAEAAKLVEDIREKHRIPGMSAAVWAGDRVVWSQGFGLASVELDAPVTRSTRFRLGSTSKLFTATLAAKLAQSGKVDLDRDIREYVTDFPDKGQSITLRQLLGHQGGIRHYTGKDFDVRQPGGMIDLRPYPDTAAALALFSEDALVAPPGTKYAYSTFGYTLISAVLERATGKGFLELIRDEITTPLGLDTVCGDEFRAVVSGRTRFYEEDSGGGIVLASPVNAAYKWAGGGLLSSAEDLVRFGSAQFAPGYLEGEIHTTMFTPQSTADGKRTHVGLGWRIGADKEGRRIVHHAGNMGGCRAVLVVYPERKLAVALLSNLTGTPGPIEDHAQAVAAPFLAAP